MELVINYVGDGFMYYVVYKHAASNEEKNPGPDFLYQNSERAS
jgi:hypothetical protein